MHTNDYISVVMATHNDETYIEEAIISVLSQTYKNFEFIIIDDGSSDNTLTIIRKYAEIDSRIRILSRENRGLSASLNEGYQLAKGDWIARMDADDVSVQNRLERQLYWVKLHAADICGTWIKLFGEQKRIKRYYAKDSQIKAELLFGSPIGHATILMRSSLAKSLLYDSKFKYAEDYDYFERAAEAGWIFTNIPEVLYHYRFHQRQTSSAKFQEQQLESQQVRLRHWSDRAPLYQLTPDEIQVVISMRNSEPLRKVNMCTINKAFDKILFKSSNEVREVVFASIIPLYMRISGNGTNVFFALNNLYKKYQKKLPIGTSFQLFFLGIFHIHANSTLFKWLQTFYFKFSK